jgi:ribosomal protein S18 acetylase RimI-like enzyme
MNEVQCAALTPERLPDYLEFFDKRAFADNPRWSGCYCYFPIHDPDSTNWHQRTAAQNREAVCSAVADGRARGMLAYRNGKVVGWCSSGPWALYPMLQDSPEHDADSLGVIFCFVVAPEHRGLGVASTLLAAACASLREQGMSRVQARPVKHATTAAENHLGPLSMYLAAGFEIVRETVDGEVFVEKRLAEPGRPGGA